MLGRHDLSGGDDEAKVKLINDNPDAGYYAGKVGGAKFFAFNMMTEVDARHKAIMNGDRTALELAENSF